MSEYLLTPQSFQLICLKHKFVKQHENFLDLLLKNLERGFPVACSGTNSQSKHRHKGWSFICSQVGVFYGTAKRTKSI